MESHAFLNASKDRRDKCTGVKKGIAAIQSIVLMAVRQRVFDRRPIESVTYVPSIDTLLPFLMALQARIYYIGSRDLLRTQPI